MKTSTWIILGAVALFLLAQSKKPALPGGLTQTEFDNWLDFRFGQKPS